uniref:serine-rich adhesin for platelets-like isoform X2 n=1 Tax=Myxine glutinosa TaxID=7769 RepID=UPI00358EA24F
MTKQRKASTDPSSTSIESDEAEKEPRGILPPLPGNGPLEALLSDKPMGVVDTTKIGSDANHTVVSSLSEIFDIAHLAQDTENDPNDTNTKLCGNREVEISGQVIEPFSDCDTVVKSITVENRLDDANGDASSFMSNGVSSFVTATDSSELIVTGHQDIDIPVNLLNGNSVLPSCDFELDTSTPKEHHGFTRNLQDNSAFASALSFLPENAGKDASIMTFDKTVCSEKPLDEVSYPCSITPPNQNCSLLLNVDTQTRKQSNEVLLDNNELCKTNASQDVLQNYSSRSVQPEEKVSNDASEQGFTALKAPASLPIVGGDHFSQELAIDPSSLPHDCGLRKSEVANRSSNDIQPLTSGNVDCQIESENYNNSSANHIMQINNQIKPDPTAEVGIEENVAVAIGLPSLCIKDTSKLAFEEHIEKLVSSLINEAAKEVSGICNGHAVLHSCSSTVCNLDKKSELVNVPAEITIPQAMSTDVKKEGVPSALVTEESSEQANTNDGESEGAFANAATCLETSSSKDIPHCLNIYDQNAQYTTLNGTFVAVADQSKPYTPLLDMLTRQKGQLKEQMDRSDALTKAETAEKTEKKDYLACTITNGLVSNFLSEALEQFCELQKCAEKKCESVVLPGEVVESEHVLVNCTTTDEEHFIKSPTQEDDMHTPENEVDPDMCTSPLASPRPESPASHQPEQVSNGSCNQEEPTSPLGYLSLRHTPFDAGHLLDDQDWFDEDFGLSSKLRARQQQQQSMKIQSMPDEMLKETGSGSIDLSIYSESNADFESEEQQFFVPHSAVEVQALVHAALRELHKLEELGESAGGVVAPRSFLGLDCRGHDVESVSRRVYKQMLILDEVLQALGLQGGNADVDCKGADGECDEGANCISGAPNLPRAVKWGKKLRDQVDIILARDLHSEEPEWVTYDIDEVEVKMQTADAIFEALLDDTAVLLNSLPCRSAQPGRLPTSCI